MAKNAPLHPDPAGGGRAGRPVEPGGDEPLSDHGQAAAVAAGLGLSGDVVAAVCSHGRGQLPCVLLGGLPAQKKTGPDSLRHTAGRQFCLAAAVFSLWTAVAVLRLAAASDRSGLGLYDSVWLHPVQSRKADAALSAVAVLCCLSEPGRGASELKPRLSLFKKQNLIRRFLDNV